VIAARKPKHHQRLVERRPNVVRAVPAGVNRGVGADHVVIGQQMREPELFDALAVRADRSGVPSELGLGKHHSNAHVHSFAWLPDRR